MIMIYEFVKYIFMECLHCLLFNWTALYGAIFVAIFSMILDIKKYHHVYLTMASFRKPKETKIFFYLFRILLRLLVTLLKIRKIKLSVKFSFIIFDEIQ